MNAFGSSSILFYDTDDGTSDKSYSHAQVAGIDLYPRKLTAALGKKISKRSKIKFFVAVYNYNHLKSIRYSVDIPLDKTVVRRDVVLNIRLGERPKPSLRTGIKQAKTSGSSRSYSFRTTPMLSK
ncbi:60S ribosomal protein L27-like [Monodelphis domestica]|uniref:60S ribosomal protein L27-like n=1 Tax=Monodelphis domestica TaxID=13616 RepID=UPI0000F2B958|nr:60S ribosomal protein L27-like [Monodelphis domestica]